MREHPILFTGPNVGLILADKKDQTRRTMRGVVMERGRPRWQPDRHTDIDLLTSADLAILYCPYGQAGDTLWVREAFKYDTSLEGGSIPRLGIAFGKGVIWREGCPDDTGPWKPSIFMPRWASRLLLEVTQVRGQRLQDITEEDARAEGVASVAAYRALWDSINAKKHPWESNPFVWVVDFRRASAAQAESLL